MNRHPVVIVKNPGSTDKALAALSDIPEKRVCEGAVSALQRLEETPTHVLVAELALEDMSALELAEMVREIDAEKKRFTFIILVGDVQDLVTDAFAETVDAVVSAGDAPGLVAATVAGARLSARVNELTASNARLAAERAVLEQGQMIDPVTGLGNRRMADQVLQDMIRQAEARGGAVCLLMLGIGNYHQTRDKYDERIASELVAALSDRLQSLVRPLDTVTYLGEGIFGILLLQPSIEHCTPQCYQRIFDGVQLKSYRTSAGYLDASIGLSICASQADTGAPNPETMVNTATSLLQESIDTKQIRVTHLTD